MLGNGFLAGKTYFSALCFFNAIVHIRFIQISEAIIAEIVFSSGIGWSD